jgi:hypothetical protein
MANEVTKIEQDWSGKLNRKNERSTDGTVYCAKGDN